MVEGLLSTKGILSNTRGQLAIFVALVFQVLFVLFAMAINVALIVHDKINLQNAVDLAAYYAASKQAEMLNSIAHQNYQIRQAWKLLAWRYRVLGTAGIIQHNGVNSPQFFHPSRFGADNASFTESEWFGASVSTKELYPVICINSRPTWTIGSPPDENACKDRNLSVPEIPVIPNIASFNPINAVINRFSSQLQNNFNMSCQNIGIWNWWYMKAIKESYRQDMANRRRVIEAMARAVSRPAETWVDIDGQSVGAGARQTFYKNLTWSNSTTAPDEIAFELYNSFSPYAEDPQWIKPIMIVPHFQYIDSLQTTGCHMGAKQFANPPLNTFHQDWAFIMGNLEGAKLLADIGFAYPDYLPERLISGYEKNPWMMAYVGVKASVKSRQIFHPFGEPVTITAQAYAKPFGGRIGPWYGREWIPGDTESSGFKVDVRGSPRTKAGGLMDNFNDPDRLPNYSRFPGDELGLSSRLAQASLLSLSDNFNGSLNYYYDIYSTIKKGSYNDPLSWNRLANQQPRTRIYEIAAIVPDLFDVTYYSVDANYWGNYGARINANKQALGIQDDVVVRPDLGFREGVEVLQGYNVRKQIEFARASGLQIPKAFYYVKDFQHLLTGWLPGPLANNFPPATDPNIPFGRCDTPDFSGGDSPKQNVPTNPGSCIVGGRVGYSVKLVSGSYLKSNGHNMGSGSSKGPIQNPPPF